MSDIPQTISESDLAYILKDKVARIELLLEIVDKNRNIVPLVPNPIQRDVLTNETGRDVYVKPGQVGFTSIVMADYLLDTLTVPGTISVVISHEEFITQRHLVKVQSFYDRLLRRVPSIPKMHHKSAFEKTFPEVDGTFYIGSARAYVFGRGELINNLLCDEYAFWEPDSISRIMVPILKRVPPSMRIKVGSTPNGSEGNSFYELYMAAKEGLDIGESVFTPHFYPWWLHPEYSISYDCPYALPRDRVPVLDLTADERKLVESYGLTHDQIRWRRYSIAELLSLDRSGEKAKMFQQEFPENDVDCFLAAGDMAYDVEMVNYLCKKCYPAPRIIEDGVRQWFPPEADEAYIVSIDVGIAKASETVISVWRFWEENGIEKCKHYATKGGLILPDEAARIAKNLARHYNRALVTWDAASQGEAVAVSMKDYGNVYYRTDIISGKQRMVPGWLTTPKSKLYMHNQVRMMLPQLECYDLDIMGQLRNMRFDGDKLFAVGMDDYHDSMGIAIVCRGSIPVTVGFAGESGWTW